MTRRELLGSGLAAALISPRPGAAAPTATDGFGPPQRFDLPSLLEEAQRLAAAPYQAPVVNSAAILDRLDYDAFQQIRFQADQALWPPGQGSFPIQLFPLGSSFRTPVMIYRVEQGEARQVLYTPALFDFGKADFARALPPDSGFAGFRVMHPNNRTDWLAFLGASYFRSAGELDQYGLSARAVAIDVALPIPEEFPRFTAFWLEEPPDLPGKVLIHALLDGPSLAGALRIEAAGDHRIVLDIEAHFFPRADIARLGVAPLTSMFWYGKNNRARAIDWRPELHDSDGLALWTGADERIWRPLDDPATVRTNSFFDRDPRGFGLLQRERNFADYQDDGVFYERRPSVWVEPREAWGKGAVQLVEIPTDDETADNIVAYWVPEAPVRKGDRLRFRYRQYWLADEPFPPAIGRVVATRTGVGGVPGQARPPGQRKFVIDFAGGQLGDLGLHDSVEPVVWASHGRIVNPYALPIVGTREWRAVFDLMPDGPDPADLRLFLRRNGTALTETWLYEYLP
jgi:glucans biosynthesis protein